MPFCKQYNLCFIHIPKTAGTTIERALNIDINYENLLYLDKYENYDVCPQHFYINEIQQINNLSTYDIFTVVRNPFDRLVSEYHHYNKNWWARKYHNLPFKRFVEICLSIPEKERRYAFDGHLELQTNYIADSSLNINIFKYENIQEAFDWINLKVNQKLCFTHERKSCRNPYRDYYTNYTKDIVKKFYQKDLEKFNYTF